MTLNNALNLFGIKSLENLNESQLKLTYIKLAKTRHPDTTGSHEQFVELKEAHDILLDILRQKDSRFPAFLTRQENSTLTPTNYKVLKDQYELLEDTKINVSELIVKMQSKKEAIENQAIIELKQMEEEIDNNRWYKFTKNFLNKYPQKYYDEKYRLKVKAQSLKSSVDKQIFKEIIGEYSKTMDMLQMNLGRIDALPLEANDSSEILK